jgi:hypothetical protein
MATPKAPVRIISTIMAILLLKNKLNVYQKVS